MYQKIFIYIIIEIYMVMFIGIDKHHMQNSIKINYNVPLLTRLILLSNSDSYS